VVNTVLLHGKKPKSLPQMRKIYAIGETLLDIIFNQDQPQAAKAGGAMLNTVVSLGRISLPVSFISEYGQDDVGNLIDNFLKENGVNTSSVHRYYDGNTALSLAFLDEKNNAHYTFYKNYPSKRLDIELPSPVEDDIVLFGSFYALSLEIRNQLVSFIQGAKKNGAVIIYDPNFRKSHINDLKILKPLMVENIRMATIVRGSDEDFRNIFGANNPDEAWETVKKYNKCLIYTYSTSGVFVRTSSFSGKFPVKRIKPVSTIGAGDNFNAGIIASLYQYKLKNNIDKMGKEDWEKVISTAVDFATNVCLSYDNYIDRAFASKYLSASRFQM
jgi:fructokinase